MKMPASSDIFLFEEFRLDRTGGGLFRRDDRGAFVPVVIGSRALGILATLIERRRDVVSKDEIIATLDDRIDGKISESEDRMKHYFDLTVETIRHDLLGANKDRIENHDDRLKRLERHAGMPAA